MNTEPEICADVDNLGANPMPTEVSFDFDSHLLVYFTSQWSEGLDESRSQLLLAFEILNGNGFFESTPFEWGLSTNARTHASGTLMWTFEDVPAGDYRRPAPPGDLSD